MAASPGRNTCGDSHETGRLVPRRFSSHPSSSCTTLPAGARSRHPAIGVARRRFSWPTGITAQGGPEAKRACSGTRCDRKRRVERSGRTQVLGNLGRLVRRTSEYGTSQVVHGTSTRRLHARSQRRHDADEGRAVAACRDAGFARAGLHRARVQRDRAAAGARPTGTDGAPDGGDDRGVGSGTRDDPADVEALELSRAEMQRLLADFTEKRWSSVRARSRATPPRRRVPWTCCRPPISSATGWVT